MFERYTERARRVIFFARYEASLAGAEAIDPEHLLLAIAREDKPLLAQFLPNGKGSIELIRSRIERHVSDRERIATRPRPRLRTEAYIYTGQGRESP